MSTASRCILGITLSLVLSLSHAAAERPVGEWSGDVATPLGKLPLLIRLQDADGQLGGDLESVSQAPGQKMPLSSVTAADDRLSFAVPTIGARFEGAWKDGEQAWVGTFAQGDKSFPLALHRGAPAPAVVVAGLDGEWRATLPRGGVRLRLVLNVKTGTDGTRVTLDSPDLTAFGLPVEAFSRSGDAVHFRVPAANASFDGTLEDDKQSMSGRWTRPGQPNANVTFNRYDAVSQRSLTQEPVASIGYRSLEVRFPNPRSAGVVLAGTLTVPTGKGPFPAAVLISGSGAQDRDETVWGHKPFAVLADYLSRHGIAVLRYDDRGYAASTGDFGEATSADFATDANAALDFLHARSEVDPHEVGFIGHSEGGMVGPIAAVTNDRVAFVVLLAGPGTATDRLLLSQRRLVGLSQGYTAEQLDASEPTVRRIFAAVRASSDVADARRRVDAMLDDRTLRMLGGSEAQRESIVDRYGSPWMRYFLDYRPAAILSRLRIPVLALNGSLDRQVPADENLAAIRTALAGHRDVTVRELPGLNHLFQTATTGAEGEYADIRETFAPSAMAIVADWILTRSQGAEPVRS